VVPMPGEDPPPLYYQSRTGLFVRADITFLRQDFSVIQPVANSGKWPGNQRFDYLVRTRAATPIELTVLEKRKQEDPMLSSPYPQREAMFSVLGGVLLLLHAPKSQGNRMIHLFTSALVP